MSNICHKLTQAPAALTTDGVCKSYGQRRALSGVTLRVARGDGVALTGPNGAGKSTLLSLLAGLTCPDEGTVRVFGEAPSRSSSRRVLGFVPQELALYPELTGAENVRLFGRLCGLRGRPLEDAVREALSKVGLLQVSSLRTSTYSGGMCRRLSVACGLVHAPSLLLLDEPFVGIDERARDQLIEALSLEKRAGLTLVLSTHARSEARALCDRVVRMTNGQLVDDEPRAAAARFAPRAAGAR